MHVLAGRYKNVRLRSESLPGLRPTARRVREKLFELVVDRIEGTRVLDLCAGSGAVGIEALSRGAIHSTFVDSSAPACAFIQLNLEACGIYPLNHTVITCTAFKYLRLTADRNDASWDIAFYDPPYATDYAPVIALFANNNLLKPGGLLAVEHSSQKQPEAEGTLEYLGTVELGESCLSFFEQKD